MRGLFFFERKKRPMGAIAKAKWRAAALAGKLLQSVSIRRAPRRRLL